MDFSAQLREAKEHFYGCRLVEAYHLFRRYFDRIPFAPEAGHAEYIGMYVRVLEELGKRSELDFYVAELERWFERAPSLEVAYPLAVVYRNLPEPRLERARELFDWIVRHPRATPYRAKAKMMLAHYYDWKLKDSAACRALVDSLESEQLDDHLRLLARIWRAKILKDEGNLESARRELNGVLEEIDPSKDWYGHFCAKVMVTSLQLAQDDLEAAEGTIVEVRELFAGKRFKSLEIQLKSLEEQIRLKREVGVVWMREKNDRCTFLYDGKQVVIRKRAPVFSLLQLFQRHSVLPKEKIVRALYGRNYQGEKDDSLIYYHIHSLRKKLATLGLPASALTCGPQGYRLLPEIQQETQPWS